MEKKEARQRVIWAKDEETQIVTARVPKRIVKALKEAFGKKHGTLTLCVLAGFDLVLKEAAKK